MYRVRQEVGNSAGALLQWHSGENQSAKKKATDAYSTLLGYAKLTSRAPRRGRENSVESKEVYGKLPHLSKNSGMQDTSSGV